MLGNFVRPLRERMEDNGSERQEKDTIMKTTTKNAGIKVTVGVKAGGLNPNHNSSGLKVKAGVRAGVTELKPNHTARQLNLR